MIAWGSAILLSACAPEPKILSQKDRAAKEAETIKFCMTVSDVITPKDKICGPYYDRVKEEVSKDSDAARVAWQVEQETRRAAAAASDARREISSLELITCRRALRNMMRDPSSFRVNKETRAEGGLIDYTATNGFGGPDRNIFRCSTVENLNS